MVKRRRYPDDIMDSNVNIGDIQQSYDHAVLEVSCERSSSSNLARGTLCNILPTPEFSRLSTMTTSTATGTSSTSSHPARIYLKCSRTGAEIRSRVPATRASSISSEFPFNKTTAYSRSCCTMAQHCTREGHSCRLLSPRAVAL